MDKFKNNFETVYDENVEEIVVGARKWHEHDEKDSSGRLRKFKRNF